MKPKYIAVLTLLIIATAVVVIELKREAKIGSITLDQKPKNLPVPLDNREWKSYKNSTFDFEFSYPEDYILNEASTTSSTLTQITLMNKAAIGDFQTAYHVLLNKDYNANSQFLSRLPRFDYVTSTIAGNDAIIIEDNQELPGTKEVVIQTDSYFLYFTAWKNVAKSDEVDRIVSTFQLPPSILNINLWKEYKDANMGISFSYPPASHIKNDNMNMVAIDSVENLGKTISGAKDFVRGYGLTIEKNPPEANFNIKDWLFEHYSISELPPLDIVRIANHAGYFLGDGPDFGSTPSDTYIVPTERGVYLVSYTNFPDLNSNGSFERNEKIINKIISTLKFIQ